MTDNNENLLPKNLEAERAILGSILIEPKTLDQVSWLTASDFYWESNAFIWLALVELNQQQKPADFILLSDALEQRGQLEEIGGLPYLLDLITETHTSLHVEHYADLVKKAANLRNCVSLGVELVKFAHDDHPDMTADAVLIAAQEMAFVRLTGANNKDGLQHIKPGVQALVDRISTQALNPGKGVGLPTGFAQLDRLLGGLQKSDLIILGGRPTMGKTSLAMNIVEAVAVAGYHVGVFSLEMSQEQLLERLLATRTGIDSHRLRLGQIHEEEWPILLEQGSMLSNANIYVDQDASATIADMRSKIKRAWTVQPLDLIVIDYLQLMTGSAKASNRQEVVSEISRQLKKLAIELNIPILALSQLSRALENRADKRPMLSDLRESGSLEQDPDIVMFIYRDEHYNPETAQKNTAELIVAKHRHGTTGNIPLFFRKELTQFTNLETERIDLSDYYNAQDPEPMPAYRRQQPTPAAHNYDEQLYD